MSGSIDIHAKVASRSGSVAAAIAAAHKSQVTRSYILDKALSDPKAAFLAVYEEIRASIVQEAESRFELNGQRRNYIIKMMDANCIGGKYNRGLTVLEIAVSLTEDIAHDTALRNRILHDSIVCGWAIEFMQAHFLVLDDIMDHSVTRRGKPCWYRYPGVSTSVAINDGLILFAWVSRMVELFLGDHAYMPSIMTTLHDVHMKTCMGQFYDTTSMIDDANIDPEVPSSTTTDFRDYTVANYNRIAKFKTAYYTYHASFLLGLLVTRKSHVVQAATVERLALVVGEYFQVQDDFLDCFGTPEQIGKIGTDIEDKKCCWLAAKFQEVATTEQKAIFAANYGFNDPAKVAVIKQLYRDVGMTNLFEVYERQQVATTESLLADLASQNAPFETAVRKLWNRTYKRSK